MTQLGPVGSVSAASKISLAPLPSSSGVLPLVETSMEAVKEWQQPIGLLGLVRREASGLKLNQSIIGIVQIVWVELLNSLCASALLFLLVIEPVA